MKFGVRELIFVAVMLGLLGSSYFLVFNKANEKRLTLEAEIDRKQKALGDLERATRRHRRPEAEDRRAPAGDRVLRGQAPAEREIDKVLKEVTQARPRATAWSSARSRPARSTGPPTTTSSRSR